MTLPELLTSIKALADKATPDWECLDSPVQFEGLTHRKDILSGQIGSVHRYKVASGVCENEAEFIAHARQDIPRLVTALERAIKQRNTAMGMFGHLASQETFDEEIEAILKGEK